MSTTVMLIVSFAAAGGLGVWMLLHSLVPERSDLVLTLRRPRNLKPPAPVAVVDAREPGVTRMGAAQGWIERQLESVSWLVTPTDDLALTEISRGTFLLVRVSAVLGGLLVGPIYSLMFVVMGLGVPLALPVGAGVVMAVVGWVAVGAVVHGRAVSRRREMRYALVGFLNLVALHRAAGAEINEALTNAAASSNSWSYRRISQRMDAAGRLGQSGFIGLVGLAEELGIEELGDLADIADLAGTAGASVYQTLLARAQSLRRELQNDEEEAAAVASNKLAVPKVILTFTTFAFLLYPALMRLTE